MKQAKKIAIIGLLAALVLGTVGVGLYYRHYFVVFVFGVWLTLEVLIHQFGLKRDFKRHLSKERVFRRTSILAPLESLYREWSLSSLMLLDEETNTLKRDPQLSLVQRKELDQFCDVVELKRLTTCRDLKAKKALRQLFCYQANRDAFGDSVDTVLDAKDSLQDMTESAVLVSRLYRKVFEATLSANPILSHNARELLENIFGFKFDVGVYQTRIEALSDHMQRDGGLPFLILNLLRMRQWAKVKDLATRLLTSNIEVEEEVRSALYWLTEIEWFHRTKNEPIKEYDVMIRYLYHLCFTNPERAQFLEIDSQFYSQFETVNELAKEAFLFKETLVDKFLELWKEQEGFFDSIFQELLEVMLGRQSKIYDEHSAWERLWSREKEAFSKEYLYVVEGNLCYAGGHFEDARSYYEKALKMHPSLRAGLLNSVFAYAKLGKTELHSIQIAKIIEEAALFPSSLYVAGNSYLLLEMETKSQEFYQQLETIPGWERKTNYYRSTFCYENGLYEKALLYARMAQEDNPEDSTVLYHLSLCYNSVGEKERALDAVKRVPDGPNWLDYYRFTLERDSGRAEEASKTLMQLPIEYFEDPEELDAALEFARERQDLTLLRRLRNR